MVELWMIDWTLDGAALILSVVLFAYLRSLSAKDVLTLIACCSLYAAHEAWESRTLGGASHRAVEEAILSGLSVVATCH